MTDLSMAEVIRLHTHSLTHLSAVTQQKYQQFFSRCLVHVAKQAGNTWQERWDACESNLGTGEGQWPGGHYSLDYQLDMTKMVKHFACLGIIRPSYDFLLHKEFGMVAGIYWASRPERSRELTDATSGFNLSRFGLNQMMVPLARIAVHTGRDVTELTTDDFHAYADYCYGHNLVPRGYIVAQNVLVRLGYIKDELLTSHTRMRRYQESVAQLVDRYGVVSRPVRDLLVRYIEERAPSLDYSTLRNVVTQLVGLYWLEIEALAPGLDTLHLPPEVARAWKQSVLESDQAKGQQRAERLFYFVRSMYLDLRDWSIERPDEWGGHLYSSPVTETDLALYNKTGHTHKHKAKMHDRIRRLAPFLPRLMSFVRRHLTHVQAIGQAITQVVPGAPFQVQGVDYERVQLRADEGTVYERVDEPLYYRRAGDPSSASSISYEKEEESAFWCWAGLEVLRLTGTRIEECLELTDLSISKLVLADGEQVVMLCIAPSKTDRERMFPVSKELLNVLARIQRRVAGPDGKVPRTVKYDSGERVETAPLPFLFVRKHRGRLIQVGHSFLRDRLTWACEQANLRDERGEPVRLVLHDMRRLFATQAVNDGLPVHVVAKLLGHVDINTTMGYAAVYEREAVQAYQEHLSRRRKERPAEEYREPTAAELEEFQTHFRRRQLALGSCYRPYQTPCSHEHACVRCPMLVVDPAQMPRLIEIEHDTVRLLKEAQANEWVGEVAGLELTLERIQSKKGQVERSLDHSQ
jgi:integrase